MPSWYPSPRLDGVLSKFECARWTELAAICGCWCGTDSYEAALKTAAAIPLYNVPGTLFSLAQLLSYVTRVAKFFTEVSKDTTAKFENKAICAAL